MLYPLGTRTWRREQWPYAGTVGDPCLSKWGSSQVSACPVCAGVGGLSRPVEGTNIFSKWQWLPRLGPTHGRARMCGCSCACRAHPLRSAVSRNLVSSHSPVPTPEAPTWLLPSLCSLRPLVPCWHLSTFPKREHTSCLGFGPHFRAQPHHHLSLCHRWAAGHGKGQHQLIHKLHEHLGRFGDFVECPHVCRPHGRQQDTA